MPETDPTITPRCSRCGSDEMIPDAFLYAEGYGGPKMSIGVNKNPKARVLKGPVRTPLRFKVCGDCGLVETEAEDPHALWEAHVERLTREFED
ncbi:hypothetical protein [Rubrivirga sp. IMCC45206]|uniref:hypothetical protein n=1 Tax=Rubrivirga sp. IMCC45206 TaxID=3391614 RepID=UPI0039900649